MVADKKRLYIALYPSGVVNNEERRYHWAFMIGPKAEHKDQTPGRRLHVKNTPVEGWKYEEVPLENVQSTTNLLARILIAKIEDEGRLVGLIRSTPIIQNDPGWRCRNWISTALETIAKDGKSIGTAKLYWATIETTARQYVADKAAGGRYQNMADMQKPRPTWDMLEGKEILP